MIQFAVTVTCIVGMKSCPLAAPYRVHLKADSKPACEQMVRKGIAAFGHDAKQFTIVCEKP